jgi:hypothetical protein
MCCSSCRHQFRSAGTRCNLSLGVYHVATGLSQAGTVRTSHRSLAASDEVLVAAMDEDADRLSRARLTFRLAIAHAGESAVKIASLLAREASTASIFETNTLERSIRDIHAATKHIAMSSIGYTMAGRASFGLDLEPRH